MAENKSETESLNMHVASATEKTPQVEQPGSASAAEENPRLHTVNPAKKRKVALYLAYIGHGYQGMQKNPGAKTIEEDLFNAIHRAGGISEANADERGFQKVHWMRAARTDKGVSAVGQVVSLNMVLHPPGIVDRMNAELPEQIRVLGHRRVTKGFDARKACDKRRYEYILPAWMFDPKAKSRRGAVTGAEVPLKADSDGAADNGDVNVVDGAADDNTNADANLLAAAEEADEAAQPHAIQEQTGNDKYGDSRSHRDYTVSVTTDPEYVFDGGCVERLQTILRQFEGTHNFHNYTIRTSANSAQAKRYILSFDCQGVFDIQGQPWVRMVVIGQSFMLHQIRKMVGMAIAEYRGVAPSGCLQYALGSSRDVVTPMAPDLGLFLDECYYENYNERFGHLHEPLQLSDFEVEVATFKKERLYPMIAARDTTEIVNASWLLTLNEAAFKFQTWLNNPDAAISTSAAANAAAKRAAVVEGVDLLDGDKTNDVKRAADDGNEQRVGKQKRVAPNHQWSMKSSINADFSD